MRTEPLVHAAAEFRGIHLGDSRRTARLLASVEKIQRQPHESFPTIFGSMAEREGWYRLTNNDAVEHTGLAAHLVERGRARALEAGEALLVLHDTTEYVVSGESLREGLSVRGQRQVFWGHHALVVAEADKPLVHGVAGFHPYVQHDGAWHLVNGDDDELPLACGSDRWRRMFWETHELFAEAPEVIHVMDREGDDFSLLAEMAAQGASFVVRSAHDRAASLDRERLSEILEAEPVVATRDIQLSPRGRKRPPKTRRTHPVRRQRQAKIEVRFGLVELQQPPASALANSGALTVYVVDVREVDPPDGQEPMTWRLLTTLPVTSAEEALRIVDIYRRRWLIEEFFKAIKTGCAFSKRQANTRASLLDTLAILLPVAIALLNLRTLAHTNPKASWKLVLTELQLTVLKQAVPKARLSQRSNVRAVLLAVAALGGHIKSNGEPGWQVLGRGMEKLLAQEEGWRAAMQFMRKGGEMDA